MSFADRLYILPACILPLAQPMLLLSFLRGTVDLTWRALSSFYPAGAAGGEPERGDRALLRGPALARTMHICGSSVAALLPLALFARAVGVVGDEHAVPVCAARTSGPGACTACDPCCSDLSRAECDECVSLGCDYTTVGDAGLLHEASELSHDEEDPSGRISHASCIGYGPESTRRCTEAFEARDGWGQEACIADEGTECMYIANNELRPPTSTETDLFKSGLPPELEPLPRIRRPERKHRFRRPKFLPVVAKEPKPKTTRRPLAYTGTSIADLMRMPSLVAPQFEFFTVDSMMTLPSESVSRIAAASVLVEEALTIVLSFAWTISIECTLSAKTTRRTTAWSA